MTGGATAQLVAILQSSRKDLAQFGERLHESTAFGCSPPESVSDRTVSAILVGTNPAWMCAQSLPVYVYTTYS